MIGKRSIIRCPNCQVRKIGSHWGANEGRDGFVAGERRVGQITADGASIAPFDLSVSDAQDGILALIRRQRRRLAADTIAYSAHIKYRSKPPFRSRGATSFASARITHEHAHEFARSGFDTSSANGAVPGNPIIFSKVPETVSPAEAPWSSIRKSRQAVDYEAELAVIIGKAGRGISRQERLRSCLGLHDHQ